MFNLINVLYSYNDIPYRWQYRFQDPATPSAEGMLNFHNYIMFFLILIFFVVLWMLFASLYLFKTNEKPYKFTHSSFLEITWTVVPAFLLLFIAFPSFTLLYSLEELVQYQITLKIIGHQWYWSYELSDPSLVLRYSENEDDTNSSTFDLAFDSYILPVADFKQAGFRLLEVDNAVTLPHQTHIRLLITSVDVLHSWTIPSFGVKLDACPGRLNQTQIYVYRTGTFYGQCSELCGVNHSLMPITVKITKKEYFWRFINSAVIAANAELFELRKNKFQIDGQSISN